MTTCQAIARSAGTGGDTSRVLLANPREAVLVVGNHSRVSEFAVRWLPEGSVSVRGEIAGRTFHIVASQRKGVT